MTPPDPPALRALHAQIRSCTRCPLHVARTHAVPGEGPAHPAIFLVGEAPGQKEDEQGRPFVGAAGRKLEGLLSQAGMRREDVFITSVAKCRPPGNRVPTEGEASTCKTHFLQNQIALLKPTLVVLMGRTAIQHVLEEPISLDSMHGKTIQKNGQTYFIAYHPAAMIYNQSLKPTMEADFRALAAAAKARR